MYAPGRLLFLIQRGEMRMKNDSGFFLVVVIVVVFIKNWRVELFSRQMIQLSGVTFRHEIQNLFNYTH